MILLDTHIFIWLFDDRTKLTSRQLSEIQNHAGTIGVSVVSCWEIAKLLSSGRLSLRKPLRTWLEIALSPSGIHLLDFTLDIAIESNELPGNFHRDPMDQIIVATARHWKCPLVTSDEKILKYPYVRAIR